VAGVGGAGGGVISMRAAEYMAVHGAVRADGAAGGRAGGGGGAGGSIFLEVSCVLAD
jgi:hypothetical protein